jgi:hypothetical protein
MKHHPIGGLWPLEIETPFLEGEGMGFFVFGDLRAEHSPCLRCKMKIRVLITALIIIGFGAGETWGTDWKYFGGTVLERGEKVIAFYDADSVEYSSNGNVRVWTKAVYPSEIDKMISQKEVVEKAAKKVMQGYFPPYALSKHNPQPSYDTCLEIIGWEEAVNRPEIKARARYLFEINCKTKMIRILTGTSYMDDGGIASSIKRPTEWDYISPETNSDTLRKLLCKVSK